MASMKAKKGNPFEYDTAYSLIQSGYKVKRSDMNVAGVDLIVSNPMEEVLFYVECKNRQALSWRQLLKYYAKTVKIAKQYGTQALLIFKSNRQPTLIMLGDSHPYVVEFNHYFAEKWQKRPKGYRIWQEL